MNRKVLRLATLRRHLAHYRAQGCTIALANGTFDLLHVGHVRYLREARDHCDVLVVGVNSDRSARAYKGPGRPVQPERDRADIIAALACVDYVVIFDEPDVRRLIESLRPDYHCKGTDYTPDTVPERDTARRTGTRTLICGDPKDHNTRDLLARIAATSRHPRRSR